MDGWKSTAIPMGDNIYIDELALGWAVYREEPYDVNMVNLVTLAHFDGDGSQQKAEKQARKWVKDYHENRAAISQSEGW